MTFERGFEASGTVQRLEVVPASARRSWSAEAKARIVEESFAAGANVSEVARRNGVLPQQLFGWRREARERATAMTFVPAVVEQASSSAASAGQVAGGTSEIIIELRGVTVRVPAGVSADHIERVLLAVQVSA
jgi:transposase